MRTLNWIVVGVLIAVGAIGIASYRHYLEPQRRTQIIQPSAVGTPTASIVRRTSSSDATRTTPLRVRDTTRAGWQAFEMVVNVLNVVVGVLGIWMTFYGLRLQRTALAASDGRGR